MEVQKYVPSEEEASKVPSKEELVKDFTDKRSKAVDENVNLNAADKKDCAHQEHIAGCEGGRRKCFQDCHL